MGQGSPSGTINYRELKQWARSALLFSTPAILAFLFALQNSIQQGHMFPTGPDLIFALGAAYSAFVAASIGFFKKFLTDNTGNQ